MASKKRLNGTIAAALAATAFSGLVAGSAFATPTDSSATGVGRAGNAAGTIQMADHHAEAAPTAKGSCHGQNGCKGKAETHSCKGQNDCKGKGGCNTGDNGCKGKNTCKGKGGCSTAGAH